jgi:hypothetical protein
MRSKEADWDHEKFDLEEDKRQRERASKRQEDLDKRRQEVARQHYPLSGPGPRQQVGGITVMAKAKKAAAPKGGGGFGPPGRR